MPPAQLIRSYQAEEDLIAIWTYVAQFNPDAADRLLDRLDQRFQLLATQPRSGAPSHELGEGLRHVVVGNYVAYYRVDLGIVHILRVMHGMRNIRSEDMST